MFFFRSSTKEIYLLNVITKWNTGIFSASETKDIYYISYIPIAFCTILFYLVRFYYFSIVLLINKQ